MRRGCSLLLIGLLTCAAPAAAQEVEPDPDSGFEFLDWQDWITVESDDAPELPLLRIQAGLIVAIDVTTEVEADRGALPGTRLDDLEEDQGLSNSGFSPWIELSLGGAIRVGGDLLWLQRFGDYQAQSAPVVFDGVELAEAGDLVEANVNFVNGGLFLEWDFLYGKNYRIGVVGGARYFQTEIELRSLRRGTPLQLESAVRGELLTPFFGGLVELTPFPYLSVTTQVQFINWSWRAIELKKARYVRFRLGFTIRPTTWIGFGAEYRFEVLRAEGRADRDDGRQIEGGLATNSLLLHVEFSF